jgi:hypothetical protein
MSNVYSFPIGSKVAGKAVDHSGKIHLKDLGIYVTRQPSIEEHVLIAQLNTLVQNYASDLEDDVEELILNAPKISILIDECTVPEHLVRVSVQQTLAKFNSAYDLYTASIEGPSPDEIANACGLNADEFQLYVFKRAAK